MVRFNLNDPLSHLRHFHGHSHSHTQKKDMFKEVTKSFNYWVHKFNSHKDSKALMIGASILAGLVVAGGLIGAGVSSYFAHKKVNPVSERNSRVSIDLPRQIAGSDGVQRRQKKIPLNHLDSRTPSTLTAQVSNLLNLLDPNSIKVKEKNGSKIIFLDGKKENYFNFNELKQKATAAREWIHNKADDLVREQTNGVDIKKEYLDQLDECSAKLELLEDRITQIENFDPSAI